MFCAECGATIEYGATFCGECGAPAGLPAAPVPVVARPPGPNGGISPLFIILALVAIAGISATYYFLTRSTTLEVAYESVSFDVSTEDDDTLLKGVEYTKSPGKNGSKQVKTKIWMNDDGAVTGRKIVSDRIIEPPVNEVVVKGERSESEVTQDVEDTLTGYMESWKSGDYTAMVSVAAPESMKGYGLDKVQAAYQLTGESLTAYTIGTPTVMSMDDLVASQGSQSSSYYGSEDDYEEMTPEDFPVGSIVVAQVPVSFTSHSVAAGQMNQMEYVNMGFVDGKWVIDYFGQLTAVAVNQTQREVDKGYSNDTVTELTLGVVIVYSGHMILTVSEKNATRSSSGRSSVGSYFDNLGSYYYDEDDAVVSDSLAAGQYMVIEEKSSKFSYDVKEGASQTGYLYMEPGPSEDTDTLNIKFKPHDYQNPDIAFSGIKIR